MRKGVDLLLEEMSSLVLVKVVVFDVDNDVAVVADAYTVFFFINSLLEKSYNKNEEVYMKNIFTK